LFSRREKKLQEENKMRGGAASADDAAEDRKYMALFGRPLQDARAASAPAARRAARAVYATSATALLCALALSAVAPRAAPVSLFFSLAPSPAPQARSTFMLPVDAAVDGYTRDLENMQATLQQDSLKPAGVVGDAPHLLAELGDG
jgi:hypothetical protein